MKKTLACITSAMLLVSFAGCEKQTSSLPRQTHDPTGATVEVSIQNSYSSKRILADVELGYTYYYPANKGVLISGQNIKSGQEAGYVVGVYNTETGDLMNPVVSEYCSVGTYVTDAGMEVLWEAYDAGDNGLSNFRYKLSEYDADFNELSSTDITGWFEEPSRFTEWTKDAAGNHYIIDESGSLEMYNPDGEYVDNIRGNLPPLTELFHGSDGRIYVSSNRGGVAAVNSETFALDKLDFGTLSECTGFCDGSGEYDFYCYDNLGVYGVKVADESMDEVVNWDSSDFSSGSDFTRVHRIQICPDESIVVIEQDIGTDNNNTFWHLKSRSDEEMKNLHLISIAALTRNDNLVRLVNWYNRQASNCKIVWKDYMEISETEGYEKAESTFTHDLINGVIPDILVLDSMNYEMFANKGMFEDLKPWMESDADFHNEDYYSNFFEAMEYKGELHRIAFWFMLDGILAKTEHLNGKTALSLQDYIDTNQNLSENMRLFTWNSQGNLLNYLCLRTLGSYVDYDKAECHFDTPEFISLLELCGSAALDTGAFNEDDCGNDLAMFHFAAINAGYTYHYYHTDCFHEANLTFLAPPQSQGKTSGGLFEPLGGTITMSNNSFYKEEIWDFIKFCLNAENELMLSSGDGLPVNREAMQKYIASYLNPIEIDMENGMFLTQEEADNLLAAIENADTCAYWNSQIKNIITEEAGMYFTGDCSAEQAAKNMQSRVSLYLAEQN